MPRFFFSSILFFATLSIFGQMSEAGKYYKDCLYQHLSSSGIDFYQEMQSAEKYLIIHKALEGSDRLSYVNAFERLLDNNNFLEFYKNIHEVLPAEYNLGFAAFNLFSLCSEIDINKSGSNCSCLNIQKSLLKKIYLKQFNDDEILNDLFIFTDFEDDILRMHITFLFLLNLEKKYENH